jgi:general secretion pathway protein H
MRASRRLTLIAKTRAPRGFSPIAKTRASRGFSLIEVLVVVAIVGVLALVVTLSVTGSAERQVRREAERFEGLVGQACEQAELGGREIGVVVGDGGYAFRLMSGNDWIDFPGESTLRPRQWLGGLSVALTREGRPVDLGASADATPQLVCFSSGERTPFALTLALGDAPRFRVIADDSTLKTERMGAKP